MPTDYEVASTLRLAGKTLARVASEDVKLADAADAAAKAFTMADRVDAPKVAREYEHLACEEEYEIYDYKDGGYSLLVKRSDHWYKERSKKRPKTGEQIGVVTDRKIFQDSRGRIVYWPCVQWEGELSNSMNHPMNVEPYRDNHGLSKTMMDNGQWGTHGPPAEGEEEGEK